MSYLPFLTLAGGFVYLLVGADLLVRGAVALARKAHVSPLLVAATVVAFGTSIPELVVSVRAVLTGYPGLVIGNVVGSNIANVLLVAGATAIVYPVSAGEGPLRRDTAIMLGASLLLILLGLGGDLPWGAGLLLLGGMALVLGVAVREAAQAHRRADRSLPMEWVLGLPTGKRMIALFVVAGVIGLPLGARMIVEASVEIASQLGVTDTVVGLTVLAFSTSLPELATTVVSAVQRREDVAVGTVVGSNTFNVLGIMGAASVVSPSPVPVPEQVLWVDMQLMLLSSVVLAVYVWRRKPIGRTPGLVMAGAWVVYMVVLFTGGGRAA